MAGKADAPSADCERLKKTQAEQPDGLVTKGGTCHRSGAGCVTQISSVLGRGNLSYFQRVSFYGQLGAARY